MKLKALLLLALVLPLIYLANKVSHKWATSEASQAEMRNRSSGRTYIGEIDPSTQPSTAPYDLSETDAPTMPRSILGVVVPALVVDVRSQVNGIIDSTSRT